MTGMNVFTAVTATQIWSVFEEVSKKCKRPIVVHSKAKIHDFTDWLDSNGVELDNIAVASNFQEGLGILATRDISFGEVLIKVPQKLMIVSNTDKMSAQYNLARILLEKVVEPDSFWAPYLNILPSSFPLPFMYSPKEMEALKGTTIVRLIIMNLLSIQNDHLRNNPDISWDQWVWAICAVYTRQNMLPNGQLAMIPGWDLFNHKQMQTSSEFDAGELVCYAAEDVKSNSQVFISYSKVRTTPEYFLFSGFVPEVTPNLLRILYRITNIDLKAMAMDFGYKEPFFIDLVVPIPMEMTKTNRLLCIGNGVLPDYKTIKELECFSRIIRFYKLQAKMLLQILGDSNSVDEEAIENAEDQFRINIFRYRIYERNTAAAMLADADRILSVY